MNTRFLFSVGFLFLFLHNLDRRALSQLFDVDVGRVTFLSSFLSLACFSFQRGGCGCDAAAILAAFKMTNANLPPVPCESAPADTPVRSGFISPSSQRSKVAFRGQTGRGVGSARRQRLAEPGQNGERNPPARSPLSLVDIINKVQLQLQYFG